MQMNEQILTALEVLRNFAETDFELHRIDVLEKDLTDPPKAEFIDEQTQFFNGTNFHKRKDGHYKKSSLSIHRVIYQYYYGEVPSNIDIHHRNFNPADNDISNLQPLKRSDHRHAHKNQKPTKKICPVCSKEFVPTKKGKRKQICCSVECGNIHRRKPKLKKNCIICGKEFFVSGKHPDVLCCSRSCGAKFAASKIRKPTIISKPTIIKTCPICGKQFSNSTNINTIKCCSRSCGAKLAWQTKKNN